MELKVFEFFAERGLLGMLFIAASAMLYWVIKKQVYDNAAVIKQISDGMKDFMSTAQAKDELVMNILKGINEDAKQLRKERDDCVQKLAMKMEEHDKDSIQGFKDVIGAIKKLEDGDGCELPKYHK